MKNNGKEEYPFNVCGTDMLNKLGLDLDTALKLVGITIKNKKKNKKIKTLKNISKSH